MSYQSYSVSLTEGQKANLARAYKNRWPITIRLKNDQLKGNFPLLLTKTQINRINKADKTGVDINIKIFPVLPAKQQELLNKAGPYLTNAQINQMLKSNKLKLTKKQSQDGVFFTLLLGALGSLAAPVLGSLFGKGL